MATVIDAAPASIITVDREGAIDGFNRESSTMFGIPRANAVGRSFVDLLLPISEHAEHAQSLLRGTGREIGGFVARRREARMMRADHTVVHTIIAVIPLPVGGPRAFAFFIRDATERKRALLLAAELMETQWQLRELAGRIEAAREAERTHIAREMHDDLGQQLTAIGLDIAWLGHRAHKRKRSDPEELERIDALAKLVESSFDVVRRVAMELRPAILDDLGLAEAIRWQGEDFQRRSGVHVDVTSTADGVATPRGHAVAIFRIFQELLRNIGRHAQAKHVLVTLREADHLLTLLVSDDGRGVRPAEMDGVASFGLMGMRERATLLGGRFLMEGEAGRGTVVTVTLPWHEITPP